MRTAGKAGFLHFTGGLRGLSYHILRRRKKKKKRYFQGHMIYLWTFHTFHWYFSNNSLHRCKTCSCPYWRKGQSHSVLLSVHGGQNHVEANWMPSPLPVCSDFCWSILGRLTGPWAGRPNVLQSQLLLHSKSTARGETECKKCVKLWLVLRSTEELWHPLVSTIRLSRGWLSAPHVGQRVLMRGIQ